MDGILILPSPQSWSWLEMASTLDQMLGYAVLYQHIYQRWAKDALHCLVRGTGMTSNSGLNWPL